MPAAAIKKTPVAAKAKAATKPTIPSDQTAARKVASNKPASAAIRKPQEVQSDDQSGIDPEVVTRFKDLVDRVAKSLEKKSNQVREVVEATLAELGKAFDQGESLNVLPLGKVKVHRSRPAGSGTAIMLKLRRNGAGKGGNRSDKDAIADSGQAG